MLGVVERSMILETLPEPDEFYRTYWGKKPFIVRGLVPPSVIESLIEGDDLAGLALEDGVKSRIITNSAAGDDWVCEHGPFDDDRFDDIGDKDWSLLVQNVEQYHLNTAELLKHFQFSPRWLLDDIMVSFSAPGGSVGPHTDSYHTFLVQGTGKRTWKISDTKVDDTRYVDNPDVKVLEHGFEGETFEVTAGDVIYMPPFFGHEGKTIDAALTFSVGFLGPKLSDMLSEYAHYLEEHEDLNMRYLGSELGADSAGFKLSSAQEAIRGSAISSLQSDDFSAWMAAYFSAPSHEEIEPQDESNTNIDLLSVLQDGQTLYKPEHVKMVITNASNGGLTLAIYGELISISADQMRFIEKLNDCQNITLLDLEACSDQNKAVALLTRLCHMNALSFRS